MVVVGQVFGTYGFDKAREYLGLGIIIQVLVLER
jgi:hypothetical protein